jgi:hypothetical protein
MGGGGGEGEEWQADEMSDEDRQKYMDEHPAEMGQYDDHQEGDHELHVDDVTEGSEEPEAQTSDL